MIVDKNELLNVWEGIASLMVIFIHARVPGWGGQILLLFARFAVPLFLLISGYYFYKSSYIEMRKSIKKRYQK